MFHPAGRHIILGPAVCIRQHEYCNGKVSHKQLFYGPATQARLT